MCLVGVGDAVTDVEERVTVVPAGVLVDDELLPHATRPTVITPAMPSRQVFINAVVILRSPNTDVLRVSVT